MVNNIKSTLHTQNVVPKNESIKNFFKSKEDINDKVKTIPWELPSKRFESRNSLLTEVYEVKHIGTIYHIAVATLVGFFLNTAAYDYLYKKEISLGFSLVRRGFVNFHLFIVTWLGMFLSTLLIYYGFKFWAQYRIRLKPKSWILRIWDRVCLTLFILHYPLFLCFSTLAIITNGQEVAASIALLLEMNRLLMKSHAFVRSNAPKVLTYKEHSDKELPCPNLSKFLYFSFAPTMIYQSSYPRTPTIRWNYVVKCFLEFFASIYFLSHIVERFYIVVFEDYGKSLTWKEIIIIILGNFAPSMLILFSLFFLVLHAWHNAFAEMLRFSDRLFYKDWWTSSNYERFYRTWNVVVHDWLYTYVYKDFYEIVTSKNKVLSRLMVFFLSAVFHEYILGFAFGFCLPILFVTLFGLGVLFNFFKFKEGLLGNTLLLYCNALGMSIISAFYCMEYFARINCPIENITVASYFIPQLFTCNVLKLNNHTYPFA